MKNILDCGIIQDLLPLYVEKLTSDSSTQAVEAHLETCEGCRQILNELEDPVEMVSEDEEIELDFLKKIRNKQKTIISAAVGLLVIILLAAAAVFVKVYGIGLTISPDDIVYECQYNEATRELTVHGNINLSMTAYSGVAIEEDSTYAGVLNLKVRGADRLSYHKKYNTLFTETIVIPDDGNDWQVHLVGPSYQRIPIWSSLRLEDLTPEEMDRYLYPETHVTSEQVSRITSDMTINEIQELLGDTSSTHELGSMEYVLGYVVDEQYLIQIPFSAKDYDVPCGMTGKEILDRKILRPKTISWIEGDSVIVHPE